jgi:hypothetical protein
VCGGVLLCVWGMGAGVCVCVCEGGVMACTRGMLKRRASQEQCTQALPWFNPWLLLATCISLDLHCVILYVPFLAQVHISTGSGNRGCQCVGGWVRVGNAVMGVGKCTWGMHTWNAHGGMRTGYAPCGALVVRAHPTGGGQ